AAAREDEPAQLAPFKYGQHRRRGHDTNERDRTRLTSTATPPLLTVSRQSRLPHISASRTREGAKMRGLDTDFAPHRALNSFPFLGGCVGAPVSRPKKARRTRVRPFSLQRAEQNRCCLDWR